MHNVSTQCVNRNNNSSDSKQVLKCSNKAKIRLYIK